MTAEEFFDWWNLTEDDDRRCELVDGEVIAIPLSGERHGVVCWLATVILGEYVVGRGAGHLLTNNTGLVVHREPDTVLGPDLMVFLDRFTPGAARDGFVDRVPPLVVEVLSPTDRQHETTRRVQRFLGGGVPLVWVIDPQGQTVTAFRRNELPVLYSTTDTLTGDGVLPDFTRPVRDLFNLPGQQPAA